MVGALATAATNGSFQELVVHCPQFRVMLLAECPSHASVEQSLQNLSLKHPNFELGMHIIYKNMFLPLSGAAHSSPFIYMFCHAPRTKMPYKYK